jgi:hypothetical protein
MKEYITETKTNANQDGSKDLIYNLLFCDNLDLYKSNCAQPNQYPWNILFSDKSNISDLQKIIDDSNTETRAKILAYNKQRALEQRVNEKELLGVIIEIGLDQGTDVLASFKDGSVRYLNQSGKIIIWDKKDDQAIALINQLFKDSYKVVLKIGPWDKQRRPKVAKGIVRITFLVSDGLYFGEGTVKTLFRVFP